MKRDEQAPTQDFRCPACGGEIAFTAQDTACSGCGAHYPFVRGIFDFRRQRHDYYFNPVAREEMSALIDAAATVSWDDTVRRFLRAVDPEQWIDNLVVNGRYSWKLLLELPPDARVLDLGCGLGNLTSNLAPHVGEVVALDLTWERLLFAQKRFERFNPRDRITLVAGGDRRRLPVPDGSFDCVVLSGVLEWVADDGANVPAEAPRHVRAWKMFTSFFGDTNPRRIQVTFLRELRRVLKPDGQLMVAIENRLNYEYFKGLPDHHSYLPYASLMPRFLANLYSMLRSRNPYRTYTHSYFGFKRLFRAAGFPGLEFYGLTPGYSGLAEIIPADTSRPSWAPPAPPSLKQRLKRSRYFVPAFGIIAGRARPTRESLLERALGEIGTRMGIGRREIQVSRLLVSEKDKTILLLTMPGQTAVMKIPCASNTIAGEEKNWAMLQELTAHPRLAALAPKPLTQLTVQGLQIYVEAAVPGGPLTAELNVANRALWATLVLDVIEAVTTGAPRQQVGVLGEADFDALVRTPVERLRQAGADGPGCDGALRYFGDHLRRIPVRLGPVHGDLTSDNIFVEDGRPSGVIDWEYASDRGLGVLDAIAYLEGAERVTTPGSRVETVLPRLAALEWPNDAELELLRRSYDACGIDMTMHRVFCHLSWLHHVSHQLGTKARFAPGYLELRAKPLLDRLATQ